MTKNQFVKELHSMGFQSIEYRDSISLWYKTPGKLPYPPCPIHGFPFIEITNEDYSMLGTYLGNRIRVTYETRCGHLTHEVLEVESYDSFLKKEDHFELQVTSKYGTKVIDIPYEEETMATAKKFDEAEQKKMEEFVETMKKDLDRLKALNNELTALSEEITEIKDRINEQMTKDNVRTVKCDFLTISTTDEKTVTTIDWEKLKEEDPECYKGLLEDYPAEPSVDEDEFHAMEGKEYLEIVKAYPLTKTTKGSRSYKFVKEKK